MKIKINDYFDFVKANALLEGFTKSTGFVTAIQDLDGNILSKSGWRAICNDFHRKNCETASNCIFSDTELARQISKDEKYHFYECANGLIDVGLPIVIRGEHVANFFSGQFFFEEPDLSFFVKQAQKYGFDEKAYIEALKEVPVVSKEKAETVIHFLVNITQMIIEMTAEKLELTELNQELKNSRADLMANQELLDRNLKDLKESQRIAHESEEKFQLLFNQAPLGYQSLDQEGRFIEVNQKWLDTLGYAREEVIGKWFGDFLCPEYVEGFRERFPVFKAQGHIHVEFEMLSKDGQRLFMSFEGKIGYSADGEFKQTHCILQDITDRKKAENELLYLSYHDHLTGLYNRRYFEQELKNLDTPENLPLSIIMFDVNGLKLVNDSFGHDLGDALLKKSAEAIKKACREEDIIARIGGDEFVILLPRTTAAEAAQISNHIKELASDEKAANMELSISYGYDTKKTDNQSIIEIIANAENHMYRHKLYERSSIRSKITDLIMNTLFEKSDREAAHSNRVSSICQAIASKLNMGQDAVKKMKIAGLIHDIGKIGVDERILNKPGSLTAEERGHIERHPEIGWRLLSSTDEFSELAKYVLSHHENWDGTGYPNGLKGETIPLEARIISVADTYDAMTSERSYRKKMSREEAVKELKRCSGTQFDPMIVDVFINEVLSEDSFR